MLVMLILLESEFLSGSYTQHICSVLLNYAHMLSTSKCVSRVTASYTDHLGSRSTWRL